MKNFFCTKIENEKIHPLIRTSINLNKQKYQLTNTMNQNTKFNLNKFTFKKIFIKNLKAFNLYNQNLNNYLEKYSNLDLIKQIKSETKIETEQENNLNTRISNYLNKIDKILQLKTKNNNSLLYIKKKY